MVHSACQIVLIMAVFQTIYNMSGKTNTIHTYVRPHFNLCFDEKPFQRLLLTLKEPFHDVLFHPPTAKLCLINCYLAMIV